MIMKMLWVIADTDGNAIKILAARNQQIKVRLASIVLQNVNRASSENHQILKDLSLRL